MIEYCISIKYPYGLYLINPKIFGQLLYWQVMLTSAKQSISSPDSIG